MSPEGMGRASGRRPNGFRGWTSGKRSPVVLSDAFAAVLGRFFCEDETQAAGDRRTQQAWAEIAQAVRGAASTPPVGGLHRSGLKIRDPKASG